MQHEHHRCPVTALLAWSDHVILAGEGNCLNAYHIASGRQIESVKVFERQAIHGILSARNGEHILVWGGHSIRFLTVSDDRGDIILTPGREHGADDWILDVALNQHEAGHFDAGFITAHNALWRVQDVATPVDHASTEPVRNTLERAVSGSNCILYSAHIKWLGPSHCLVASGTAFGDVILWSAFFEHDTSARTQVHYTFSAHEGSVFGVQISPRLRLPQQTECSLILASCSDDRTIRVWDISDLSTQSPTLTQIQRDTGFGSRAEDGAHSPPLLARIMGHSSRIWHVRFLTNIETDTDNVLDDLGDAYPRLLSCGEDTATNTWRLQKSTSSLPYELHRTGSKLSHSGKNIWSVAQRTDGTVFTGGADGAIAVSSTSCVQEVTREISPDILPGKDPQTKDKYKSYAFVSDATLLATPEYGRVILLVPHGEDHSATELAAPLSGLRGYSVITCLPGLGFVSGSDGVIWCYRHSQSLNPQTGRLTRFAEQQGKTAGLFAARTSTGRLFLLATTVAQQVAYLYEIRNEDAPGSDDLVSAKPLHLPNHCVVTGFAVCEIGGKDFALLGGRDGSLSFHILAVDESPQSELVDPSHTCPHLHGSEAITALVIEQSVQHGTFVFSTGRDGTFAASRLSSDPDGSLKLTLIHQLALPLGTNIEGLCICGHNHNLLVWGFRGKSFVLYNATTQQETMSIECGGAHRNWAFQPHPHGAGGTFVWTKASKVYSYTQTRQSTHIINGGAHGREIKAMAAFRAFDDEIVATGAEDTNVKLFRVDQGSGRWRCLQTLRKHNTGIQHLAWEGARLFSSGGFEEFCVWRVTADVPHLDVGVVCESTHPRSGKSDLRICGFDVQRTDNEVLEVCMAYSDSTLKLWRYSCASRVWEFLGAGDYLTACLTHVVRAGSPGNQDIILTAATDGHLALWRPNSEAQASLTWRQRHRVHQSAIHALASATLTDGSTLLATGGDDNALALTRLPAITDAPQTVLIPGAHAAAITGVLMLPTNHTATTMQAFWLVSASTDQRVKLWRVTVSTTPQGISGVEVQRVQNVFTAIADVSGLETCTLKDGGRRVVVGGVGVDVWRLPLDDRDGAGEGVGG